MSKTTTDFWTKEEENFLKNNSGYHNKELLITALDRKWTNIQKKAKSLNVNLKREDGKNSKNTCNVENLLLDDHNTYYWIGYILADGSFGNDCSVCSITSKDIEHLFKLQKLVNANFRIVKNKYLCINTQDALNNKILAKKFDIQQNKTHNPPNINIYNNMNFELFLSLFIGFIDGDGCVDRGSIKIECHSSWKNWFDMAHKKIHNQTKILAAEPKINKRGYLLYRINKNNLKFFLLNHIKQYSLPVLDVKWDRVTGNTNRIHNPITKEEIATYSHLKKEGLTRSAISDILNITINRANRIRQLTKDIHND